MDFRDDMIKLNVMTTVGGSFCFDRHQNKIYSIEKNKTIMRILIVSDIIL